MSNTISVSTSVPQADRGYPPRDHLSLSAANQGRRVDARWHLAAAVAAGEAPLRDHARDLGHWGMRAVEYHLGLERSPDDVEQLAARLPHVHAARVLHESTDKLARGTVEARILARQPLAEVAAACGLPPETVEAYEHLFFAVTGRLRAGVDIVCSAFGGGLKYWLPAEDDIDVFLKAVGFIRGPMMLEVVLRYFTTGWSVPETLDGLTRDQLHEVRLMLGVRAMMLVTLLPAEQLNRVGLLRAMLAELDRLIAAWPPEGSGTPDPELTSGWEAWKEAVLVSAGSLSGPGAGQQAA